MNKKLLLILSTTLVFLFASAIPANATVQINTDPDSMAVHLENNFTGSGSAYVDGDVYSANGKITVDSTMLSSGYFFHKSGKTFSYPDWYKSSYPDFQNKGIELGSTTYDAEFPELAEFPDYGSPVNASNQNGPLTISEDTHFGTLTITSNSNNAITINVQNKDIHLVVDTLNISNWKTIDLVGTHALYLYVNDCTGRQPLLLVNSNKNPAQTYIVSHDYIPLHADYPLYGHLFYEGISSFTTGGYASVVGSIVTDATSVTFSGSDPMQGLVYAPNAAVAMSGSSRITGRLVAKSLNMSGSARITYSENYSSFSVPSELLLKEKYTVNVTADPDGAGTISPTYTQVNSGDTIKITATPVDGYTFNGFTSSNSSMIPDSSGNLTVTGNVNIVAHFEPIVNDGDYANGLLGEYYDESTFNNSSALRMKRIDGSISSNFGYNPPAEVIEPDTFAIRWTGYIKPSVSGYYTFKTYSDDGVIVTVDNTRVIDNWGYLSLALSISETPVYLEQGKYYPITVEYQQLPLYAAVFLFWESDNVPMSLVPESNLFVEKAVYDEYITPKFYNLLSRTGTGFKNVFYSLDADGDRDYDSESVTLDNINYEWGAGAPGSIDKDEFYGEMDGYLEAKFTEDTTLVFTVDDGIRVWLNDELVIDEWGWHSNDVFQYTFATTAGSKYKIHIEYMDKGFGATMQMSWKGDALGEEIISKAYMYAPIE